jgi:hypothetical protein
LSTIQAVVANARFWAEFCRMADVPYSAFADVRGSEVVWRLKATVLSLATNGR